MNNMRTLKTILLSITALLLLCNCSPTSAKTKAEKNGWNLSMQSYTLHRFSAVEALEKTQQLGLHYIEIYPGQKMGGDFGEALFGFTLGEEDQERLKSLAASKEIRIVSSGVWTATREEWDRVFAFAENMELEFI